MNNLPLKERLCYSFAGFGQSMIYTLSASFLMNFFTDELKIQAGVAGTIFLIARLWDAVNDPIMGGFVDKTMTRWGKMRPYILFASIPILITTILTFYAPSGLNTVQRTVYAVFIYILWGMLYTIADIPYNGLASSMSTDTDVRTKLLTLSKTLVAAGTGAAVILIPYMVDFLGGGNASRGYTYTAMIISAVGMGLFVLAFFGVKERVHPEIQTNTVKDIFKAVRINKPLLLLVLSGILNSLRFIPQSSGIYFAKYNLGSSKYFSMLGGIIIGATVVAILITPFLLKFTTKRDLYVYTSLAGAALSFIIYFVGYENLTITCILLFFSSMPIGFFTILFPAMIADTVDYGEWKTGHRTEGVCFSGNTFVAKLTAGASAFITGIVLTAVGFSESNVTPAALNGIFMLVTILPAIGGLLCVVPMLFYKFTEEIQRQAVKEIEERKLRRLNENEICDPSLNKKEPR